ncbi:unnamed protein product [Heterobilharzia americana]|nr:unnamed protein product [Heterobilharzia americana]
MAWTCTSHAEPSPTPTGYARASCIRLKEGSSWLDQDMVPVDEVSYCWCESCGGDVDYLVGNPREDWNYWLRTLVTWLEIGRKNCYLQIVYSLTHTGLSTLISMFSYPLVFCLLL